MDRRSGKSSEESNSSNSIDVKSWNFLKRSRSGALLTPSTPISQKRVRSLSTDDCIVVDDSPQIPEYGDYHRIQSSPLPSEPEEISGNEESSDASSESDDEDFSPPTKSFGVSKPPKTSGGRLRNLDDDVLKHRCETYATPLIKFLAGNLFGRNIVTVGGSSKMSFNNHLTCDPERLGELFTLLVQGSAATEFAELAGSCIWNDPVTGKEGFGTAVIDAVVYQAGDFVLLRKSWDSLETDSEKDFENDDSSGIFDFRFARVSYLYNDTDLAEDYAHVQILLHGNEIDELKELAAPHVLFMTSMCEDVELFSIAGKIEVHHSKKARDEQVIEAQRFRQNEFYCQFQYDEGTHKIIDASGQYFQPNDPLDHCACCAEQQRLEILETPVTIDIASDGSILGTSKDDTFYRMDDFVYFVPVEGKLADIGQISGIELDPESEHDSRGYSASPDSCSISIRVFYRVDQLPRGIDGNKQNGVRYEDERHLYRSNVIVDICLADVEGRCNVHHVSTIDDLDSYTGFYVGESLKLNKSMTSYKTSSLKPGKLKLQRKAELELLDQEKSLQQFITAGQPLKTVEIFSGVGGLSLGLSHSNATTTKWMIEFAPSTAASAGENHNGVAFYTEDISLFLRRLVGQNDGIFGDYTARPKVGEVEMIVGGFPCPGYSGINMQPSTDDIKNSLILPTLSLVEVYRPRYVMLENVQALQWHKLGARQVGRQKTDGGVERGSMKFIYRALTCLGYQVDYRLLQAGEYGVPQSRRRLIIWAALSGHTLPSFPKPSHEFYGVSAGKGSAHKTRSALYPSISAWDAISDLPPFEWINPHQVVPESEEQQTERLERAETVPAFQILPEQPYIGHNSQDYASRPRNNYQRQLRSGSKVANHVTTSYYSKGSRTTKNGAISHAEAEQVCSVSLKLGSDYRSMPEVLQPGRLNKRDSNGLKKPPPIGWSGFKRVDKERYFGICLATPSPSTRGGPFIHPDQHRTLSVREYARAQGFPDSFQWNVETKKDVKLAYRMIGNAVPPPLTKALGEELLKVLIADFQKRAGASAAAVRDRRSTSPPKRGSDSNSSTPKTAKSAKKESFSYADGLAMTRVALLKMGSSADNAIFLEDD